MSTSLIAAALGCILLLGLLRPLVSPLRSIPGPFFTRWTDMWYLLEVVRGNFERKNMQLHDLHGPVVRYGPNRYSFSDPKVLPIIYGHGTQFAKSSWYSAWVGPGTWSLFPDRSIKRHAQGRRLFQHTYSMTALLSYESFVSTSVDLFCRRLHELSEAGKPVDLRHWFQCYAFDVIGLITYGKRLGFLDRGEDVGGVINALESHLFYATTVGLLPSWHPFLYNLRNSLAGAKGSGRGYILNFTQARIAEHVDSKVSSEETNAEESDEVVPEPFLSKFFAKNSQDPETFTREHLIAGCTSNMVAGSDTTAISLSAILYYVLKHPGSLQRLRTEVDSFYDQHTPPRDPSFTETQQMSYLQAAIKEALRLHPVGGLPLERVVPEGGAILSGHKFPSGTIVGVNAWVIHYDTQIFGDDADSFKPERWFTDNPDKLSEMNRYWMPFGVGSRNCIGRHISILEISKVIPRIIRDFDFELQGSSGSHDQVWPTLNRWFVKPTDFSVKISPRHNPVRLGAGKL